ncbi:polyadenylate-binding protein 2-like isoform X2 [Paramacrobiotus metropolitanus]|uniref:polyadenylate-binding protein 2-like isoform X2 n=1 Tax=Paramacrobiotus metropolitanus TaxID=2943436 RepID=UPI0024457156|nr:polyadenylate-binding protein 2-like isoform X2 [Paramacrobiotus metropolitanus]
MMDKPEAGKMAGEASQSAASVPEPAHADNASNGGPAAAAGEPAEYADEEFQEYEDEDYGEDLQYEDEEYPGGDNFEITATESADFGEGFEGQEEDMLEDVRTKIREMEEEAEKLRQLQSDSEKTGRPSLATATPDTDKLEVDSRSVYVGQVEYSCTNEELEAHFRPCGQIVRTTIICDRYSGHPKGYAYIEFANKDSVDAAVAMTDTILKDRQLKVVAKRTNQPGMGTAARRARRPYRGYMRSRRPSYRGYSPYYRGRSTYRGGYRGSFRRSRTRYAPY